MCSQYSFRLFTFSCVEKYEPHRHRQMQTLTRINTRNLKDACMNICTSCMYDFVAFRMIILNVLRFFKFLRLTIFLL